ncbi:hypothetical protein BGX31_010459 [Mortierella sp. GBA43]|nr:hypothetical protein BGX31_010459 [Mortierella sp. GBA43]
MEEVTQSFRLHGGGPVLNLPCDQDDGQIVIYWYEIDDVFPGAQYIRNGNNIVRKLRDTGPNGDKPQRILYHPGVILDVVVSDSVTSNPPVSSQTSGPSGTSMDDHNVGNSGVDMSDTRTQIEQLLIASLPNDSHAEVRASQDIPGSVIQAIQDERVHLNQSLLNTLEQMYQDIVDKNNNLDSNVNKMAAENSKVLNITMDVDRKVTELTRLQEASDNRQELMMEMMVRTINELVLLQNRVKALMAQSYELHEYPIPRLFVIIPQDTSTWNPANIFSYSFRLYFLCECGDHTKPTSPDIPNHVHIANHEGYEIKRPNEFFQQYGRYILIILKMLKFGINAAGVVIPAISPLVHSDPLSKAAGSLKALSSAGGVPKGIDQAISHLEKITEAFDGSPDQIENSEALEGADLRKLESFLKHRDRNNVLGNLFRTVTPEGHVKWVCRDHFRETYQEKSAKEFRDTVESLGGTFDENIGRVKVCLPKQEAERFYKALEKARSVYELDITLDWNTTRSDFRKLRSVLRKSNVRALEIDLGFHKSDRLDHRWRHGPIFDIMRHPSIHSVEIVRAPDDFNKRSSQLSQKNIFPNLKHMGLDLRSDTLGITTLLSRSQSLSSLALNDPRASGVFGFFNTLETLGELFASAGPINIYLRSRINLHSRIQVQQVYKALRRATSLHELDLSLSGDLTQWDLKWLRDALPRTNAGTLRLRVNVGDKTVRNVLDPIQRHDLIFDIIRHPSIYSVSIIGAPEDFIRKSSLLSRTNWLPNLRHMEVDLTELKKDIHGVKCLIANVADLSSLSFQGDIDNPILLRLYMAIAEYQTYPVTIVAKSLCIPPLTTAPNQSVASHQHLANLLNVDGVRIDQLVLEGRTDEEAIVDAFAKVERNRTGLKELTIKGVCERQGEQFIEDAASIVSRSELDRLDIQLEGDERRVKILESIQWKHIRHLRIEMHQECVGTLAMKALVKGRNKVEGTSELEYFGFFLHPPSAASTEQAELLQSFAQSTLVKVVAPPSIASVFTKIELVAGHSILSCGQVEISESRLLLSQHTRRWWRG